MAFIYLCILRGPKTFLTVVCILVLTTFSNPAIGAQTSTEKQDQTCSAPRLLFKNSKENNRVLDVDLDSGNSIYTIEKSPYDEIGVRNRNGSLVKFPVEQRGNRASPIATDHVIKDGVAYYKNVVLAYEYSAGDNGRFEGQNVDDTEEWRVTSGSGASAPLIVNGWSRSYSERFLFGSSPTGFIGAFSACRTVRSKRSNPPITSKCNYSGNGWNFSGGLTFGNFGTYTEAYGYSPRFAAVTKDNGLNRYATLTDFFVGRRVMYRSPPWTVTWGIYHVNASGNVNLITPIDESHKLVDSHVEESFVMFLIVGKDISGPADRYDIRVGYYFLEGELKGRLIIDPNAVASDLKNEPTDLRFGKIRANMPPSHVFFNGDDGANLVKYGINGEVVKIPGTVLNGYLAAGQLFTNEKDASGNTVAVIRQCQ